MANALKSRSKLLWFVVALVAFAAMGGAYLYQSSRDDDNSDVNTTSDLSTAQSGYNDKTKDEPSRNDVSEGGAANTPATDPTTPSNQWAVSQSGVVTVYSPVEGSTFSNGATLSGASKSSAVSFRLVDNEVGQIASGTLDVVNGKYSGKLSFSSKGSTGVLKVYTTTSDGSEVNLVKINVKF
jgi:hypothetical protein